MGDTVWDSEGRSQQVSLDSPSTILEDDVQLDIQEQMHPSCHLVLKKPNDGVPE